MDDQATSLGGFVAILKRRIWYFILPFILVLTTIVGIAYSLPAVYRSTGTILIEQQGLPTDVVRSSVSSFASERVAMIQQRVMAADNLIGLMEAHNLYAGLRSGEDATAAIKQMRSDVTLEMMVEEVIDPRSGRATEATIAFSVSFDADSPEVAQAVAAELAALYLEENAKERQQVTQEATQFLAQEANRISDEIAGLEERLAEFKTNAGESLPEAMNANLEFVRRTYDRLRDVDQSINSLTEGTILLEGELARVEPYRPLVSTTGDPVLSPTDQLKSLEAQAVALAARYSAEHPDRIKVERELKSLRAALGGGRGTSSVGSMDPDNPAYIQLRARLLANEAQLGALQKSRAELVEQLATYEKRIAEAPLVERGYLALTRDYESALARYREVRAKLMDAELAESLETQSKGERFTLIDPPRLSEEPIQPNRPSMVFLGFVLAIGSGVGSVVLRDTIDNRLYGAQAVTRVAGTAPLAVIPFINTVADRHRRRRRRLLLAVGAIAGLLVLVAFIHVLVFPLDTLLSQPSSDGENGGPLR